MERLYTGPTGSRKTTILYDRFIQIGQETGKTEHCLVFVKNATSVTDWRKRVSLQSIGPLHIYTYFGFVQRELTHYWMRVEAKLIADLLTRKRRRAPGNAQPSRVQNPLNMEQGQTQLGQNLLDTEQGQTEFRQDLAGVERSLEPTFMTVETSHFLMSRLVGEARIKEGAFGTLNATTEQIAVQLIDNLNHAAMNGLSFPEVAKRFQRWAAAEPAKESAYRDALGVMTSFRDQCLETRCLDYSLIVDLYNQYLLVDPGYVQELAQRYRYLIVDDLEKTIPQAQDLFLVLMQEVTETVLAFSPEGGFTSFFGGSPKLAEKTFFPLCQVIELTQSYTASSEARKLAQALAARVKQDKAMPETTFIKGEIQTDLRGDMLVQVAEEVDRLSERGVEPGEIALIAPIVDKVMEFTFARHFKERGFALANLTRTKRLLDEPYAQALVTLAFLVNPTWKLELNFSALVQTLSLILKLDPVRSALLSEEIFKHQLNLPDLDEIGLRPRLGFDNSDKYDHFREWVQEKQTVEVEMEHFFQTVFGELLAPLGPEEKDILACRQIINSITRFRQVMTRVKRQNEKQLGEDFIDMVLRGTLAADVLFRPPSNHEQVIIATPYRFLFSPYIKQVKYLFLLDTASENWFQSSAKELTNPFILSRQWNDEDEWCDELDQTLRKEQLTSYLQSLLGKCTTGVYVANSYYNSHGWEQEGLLTEWLQGETGAEVASDAGNGADSTIETAKSTEDNCLTIFDQLFQEDTSGSTVADSGVVEGK